MQVTSGLYSEVRNRNFTVIRACHWNFSPENFGPWTNFFIVSHTTIFEKFENIGPDNIFNS